MSYLPYINNVCFFALGWTTTTFTGARRILDTWYDDTYICEDPKNWDRIHICLNLQYCGLHLNLFSFFNFRHQQAVRRIHIRQFKLYKTVEELGNIVMSVCVCMNNLNTQTWKRKFTLELTFPVYGCIAYGTYVALQHTYYYNSIGSVVWIRR